MKSALSSFSYKAVCSKWKERYGEMDEKKTDTDKIQVNTGGSADRPSRKDGEKRRQKDRFAAGLLAGITAAVIVFAALAGIRTLITGNLPGGSKIADKQAEEKLEAIDELIDKYYLYGDKTDDDALKEGLYSGYAQALGDPYTEYYDKSETQALFESTSGEFSGIGVTMTQRTDGAVIVTNIYKDSPADKAGMQLNDVLIKVDGKDIQGMDLNSVVSRVKGEKGTEVQLTVLRGEEEVELTAVRDTIEVQTVEYKMLDEKLGYISVAEFDDVTYEQFKTAMEDLESKDMEGLIIDLRNNPGGNVETVTDMLKLLLPEGTIMSTKDKNGTTEEITCDGSHEFKKPLAVLVNGYSASASEIFSGAVQDYQKGTIVGTTTYGKGVVQQLISLGDGTCLKLTVAEYYTPSGRSINGKGVTPDVEVEYKYDEEDPQADNQLDKAVEVLMNEMNEN